MEILGTMIPLTGIVQAGWLGLTLAFCWLIYAGKLVPVSHLDLIIQGRDERIKDLKAEVDSLKTTIDMLDQALSKQAETADEITAAMDVLKKLVQALQDELTREGHDVA